MSGPPGDKLKLSLGTQGLHVACAGVSSDYAVRSNTPGLGGDDLPYKLPRDFNHFPSSTGGRHGTMAF